MPSRGEMVLARVDGSDRPIGTMRRRDALQSGAGFRVVHVLLFDESGRLALQEIASTHDRHPGFWGSSVAGYVQAGERYKEAAQRKLSEELGVEGIRLSYLGKTSMRDGASKKFICVFAAKVARDALTPNPDDFQGIDFVPVQDIRVQLTFRQRPFTPTLQHVFRFALPKVEETA